MPDARPLRLMNLMLLCICGKTSADHGPGKSDHLYTPPSGAGQVRDDQQPERVTRRGHYQLNEYRVITIANPLAGVDVVATVPSTVRWRVQCLQAQLVTSAVAMNRIPHLVITDGQGHQVYNVPPSGNQVAGLTEQYSAGVTVVAANFDNANVLVLPYVTHLLQGWTIGFSTTGLQAGDQWSNCALLVEEWLSF